MTFNLKNLNKEEKFALLFGIMSGDGCLSFVKGKNKFISITGSLDDDLPLFNEIISPILREFRGKDTNLKFRKDCRAIEFNFCDKALFNKIEEMGFPVGKKGQKLIIPKYFFDNNLIKYIMQGFFATDGSLVLTKNPNKYYPRLEAHTIHKKLTGQFHSYLVSLGLKGHFYKCKRIKKDPRWKVIQDQYRFQFNGKENLLLFSEKIGFVNPKHEKKFRDFVAYDSKYDGIVRGNTFSKQRIFREEINSDFIIKMALRGI